MIHGPARALLVLAGAGLVACAPSYRRPAAAAAADSVPSVAPDSSARPAPGSPVTIVGRVDAEGGLRADTLAGVRPDTTRVERETVLTGAVRPPAELLPPARVLVTGYRVQVLAAPDEASAASAAARVRETARDAPVYVERDDPWYKVRVGDFATREAAEPLRRRLVEAGFTEAWTVQTTIRTLQ